MSNEELQELIVKYPIVAQFASWKHRMAIALKRHGASDAQIADMHEYPNIIRDKFSFSVDEAFKNNSVNDIEFGHSRKSMADVLINMCQKSNESIKPIVEHGSYYRSCCEGNLSIIDAPKLPNDPVGVLAGAFKGCHALLCANIGSMKNVTSIETLFNGCVSLQKVIISSDEYTSDLEAEFGPCRGSFVNWQNINNTREWLSSCSNLRTPFEEVTIYCPKIKNWTTGGSFGIGTTVHLIGNKPNYWGQSLYNVGASSKRQVHTLTGVDNRFINQPSEVVNWASHCINYNNSTLTHVEFVPGTYSKDALPLQINQYLDAETIYNYIYTAYDWKTNPDNLKMPAQNITWTQSGTQQNRMDFRVESDSIKVDKLKARYGVSVIDELKTMLASRSNDKLVWKL